jgi:2-dehydro-3-deoxyphosphogluconate aldolase / (4S)-4-hydroxy-2-oxoglutarate aldolase
VKKEEVRARIEEIGIVPSIRVSSKDDAEFVAQAVSKGGIPIVEITMTVPNCLEVIGHLTSERPDMIVGAGSVVDVEAAHCALDAGAKFLTSEGLDQEVLEFAVKKGVVIFPGALTPTEVITAWKAGSDFVKIIPCAAVGGEDYIKRLKAALPQVPLIAAGGVNQMTATNYILAGASALGIGTDLIPKNAISLRQAERIRVLSKRFLGFVKEARAQLAPAAESPAAKKNYEAGSLTIEK